MDEYRVQIKRYGIGWEIHSYHGDRYHAMRAAELLKPELEAESFDAQVRVQAIHWDTIE
jgi:hypothetical protein